MTERMENKETTKILLVDDRPDGLIALEAVLKETHYEIHMASSGREALAQVFDKDFAVIILDVQMPGMDGFETARIIRSRERSKDIPILFVTAINKDPAHIVKGYAMGGVDYLFKPFDPIVLMAKVKAFANLYEINQELVSQTRRLKAAEERSHLLFKTVNDIITTCDLEGNLTSLSPAFERTLGLLESDWLGKPIWSLAHPEDEQRLLRRYEDCAMGRLGPLEEARFKSASGDYLVLEYSAKPIVENNLVTGVLSVARDISERTRAEEERRRRYELERSNKELEQFAYVCSHDLQEPLRMIGNFTQLLERKLKGKLDDDSKLYMNYIVDGARRMSMLIRDILDFACLGAGIELSRVDVGSAYLEAVSFLGQRLTEASAQSPDFAFASGTRRSLQSWCVSFRI